MKIDQISKRKLVGVEELAEYLDIKVSTIYEWVNQRKIPHIKVGRLVKFDLADIDKWLEQKKVEVREF